MTYPAFIKSLEAVGAWLHCEERSTLLRYSDDDDVTSVDIGIASANVLMPTKTANWLSDFDWHKIKIDAQEAAGRLKDYEIGRNIDDFSPGYLYCMVHPVGISKIGLSVNPIKRREQICKEFGLSKTELPFIGLIKTDTMRSSEMCLHDLFSDRRIGGEWFALDITRQNMISKMYRMNHSTIEYRLREDLMWGGIKSDEEVKKFMEAY